jgi:hypothetical protein
MSNLKVPVMIESYLLPNNNNNDNDNDIIK